MKIQTLEQLRISFYAHRLKILRGLLVAIAMPLLVLPSRIERPEFETQFNLIGSEASIFLVGLCMWVISVMLLTGVNGKHRLVKIIICVLLCMVLSTIIYELSPFEDYPIYSLKKREWPYRVTRMMLRGLFMAGFVIPAFYYFENRDKRKKAVRDMERLKQENLAIQLTALRQQINPHFLFNALNVLKSGANEEWVKNYVIKLSDIYRYILTHQNDQNLVSVAIELEFIHAYNFVLQERFGEGLSIVTDLGPEVEDKQIPILALQVLVENAVKHNIISASKPLKIQIFSDEDYITVRNNLQPRSKGWEYSESLGTGLLNLQDRYELLSEMGISVNEDANFFTVRIPMIYDKCVVA
ncbi:sensor histidine kinase [Dyadobacter sp. CY356]|uniref:sensor histidine kinase n=1 Tax=Dyadobacter sp. CY356 TaxID=2906442 RepID=UPI001F23147F|nr:histidine kinase [Dyadobacter sp. CY356]MCF0055082.1 histidine kinase [Dyadobacter sp. CY356]